MLKPEEVKEENVFTNIKMKNRKTGWENRDERRTSGRKGNEKTEEI